ncbi:ABC transporter permease [Cryptosporangium aurantiacum]|uniref:Putative ABC transport system permease protein n=1 Tax=Cryptosporangium aurantiacum TaxID=134849 RepID=A0A1M7P8A8_9ACTN|nr:ABC transporter permease [Cryptosporangium aurantiacum]SHN12948.1 putative ABC transport system permease protein [Cryptosporangium aurantiacum]
MLRYVLSSVRAHKGRLLLTALAITLGVSLVAATFVVIDTWRAAADASAHHRPRGVDVVVGHDGDEPVPAALMDRLERVEGVASTTGVVVGVAQILGRDGHPVAGRDPMARTIDASFDDSLRAGRVPARPGEVVIDPATAASERYRVGDEIRIVSSASLPEPVTVVGLLDPPEQPGAAFVGVHPSAARDLLARPGLVSFVEVRGTPGTDERVLRDRVSAVVGEQYPVITGSELQAEVDSAAEPDPLFTTIFLIASLVALFIGAFLIRNTYTIVLASRARELALLRCVGAQRRQLRRAVLLEAAIVGTVASLGGLVLGVAIGWGVAALLEAAGAVPVDVTGRMPRLLPRTVAITLAVGVVTALISAWGPARRATRVPPIAALRGEVYVLDRRVRRVRAIVGGLASLCGIGLLLAGGLADPAADALVRVGAGLTVVGVLVLGPVSTPPIARLVGRLIHPGRGVAGRLAAENAVRSPRRTAATVLPLVIGLALVGFLTTLAAGSRASATGGFDHAFRADFQARAFSPDASMSPAVPRRLEALPEVAVVAAIQSADAELTARDREAAGIGLVGVDPSRLAATLALNGNLADVTDGGIALRRSVARERGVTVGSSVRVRGAGDSERTFVVRAIYDTSGFGDLVASRIADFDAVITPADFRRLIGDPGVTTVYASLRDGVPPDRARTAIGRSLAGHPTVEITSRAELRGQLAADLDPALRVYFSLFGLMIVIALFGIANTLALSVLERVREIGLLRVVGMQRRQIRAMLCWEAATVAATGAVIGLALGSLVGWATTRALNLSATDVPVALLVACAGGAVLASLLAAALPGRRAARVDVLRALATE